MLIITVLTLEFVNCHNRIGYNMKLSKPIKFEDHLIDYTNEISGA